MEHEKIDRLIEVLQQVRNRPEMYFGQPDDIDKAHVFLWGFMLAAIPLLNMELSDCISNRRKATNKRGLEHTSFGVAKELMKKGYINSQIVIEQIEIEIEMWQIFRDNLEN